MIFDINNQSDKPGYGMQLKSGATSLTEAWDAGPGSSQDHFMLGQIQEWFYHDLAGIQNAPGQRGLQKNCHQPAARRRCVVGESQLQFHPWKNCERLEARRRKIHLEIFNSAKHDGDGFCSRKIRRRSGQNRRRNILADGKQPGDICNRLRRLHICLKPMNTLPPNIPVAILAGGLATRLRPITEKIPKSLVPVAGKPFLAHQLELLRSRGIRRAVFASDISAK